MTRHDAGLPWTLPRLRAGRGADAQAAADLIARCWGEAYVGLIPASAMLREGSRAEGERMRAALYDPYHVVHVAEHAGDLIATIMAGPARDPALACDGEIYALYVRRAYWRHGLGRALMARAAGQLAKRHCRAIGLWVLKENEAARGFYERIAGRLLPGERRTTYRGARLAEVAYRWNSAADMAVRCSGPPMS